MSTTRSDGTRGGTVPTGGGASTALYTFTVFLPSDGPTSGPWTVNVEDAMAAMGQRASLDIALDRNTGVNGEKLYATITAKSMGSFGASAIVVTSTLGDRSFKWYGLVAH
jgi:hypothetical protein